MDLTHHRPRLGLPVDHVRKAAELMEEERENVEFPSGLRVWNLILILPWGVVG